MARLEIVCGRIASPPGDAVGQIAPLLALGLVDMMSRLGLWNVGTLVGVAVGSAIAIAAEVFFE